VQLASYRTPSAFDLLRSGDRFDAVLVDLLDSPGFRNLCRGSPEFPSRSKSASAFAIGRSLKGVAANVGNCLNWHRVSSA